MRSRCPAAKRLRLLAVLALGTTALPLPWAAPSSDEPPPPPPYSEEELRAARAQLADRMQGVNSQNERADRIVRLALIERPTGALGYLAEQAFEVEGASSPKTLQLVFREGNPYAQKRILDLYVKEWNLLSTGWDPWRWSMVAKGLESDHEEVRNAAARLAATRPIRQIGHKMIDTTLEHPELTLAAVLAIDMAQDFRPVRWVLDQLEHEDPAIRQAARRAVQSIGRPAAERLRERIEDADGDERARLVEVLLLVAHPDDIALLYRWMETDGSSYPDTAESVAAVLAALDIGNYQPELVERPELVIGTTGKTGESAKLSRP